MKRAKITGETLSTGSSQADSFLQGIGGFLGGGGVGNAIGQGIGSLFGGGARPSKTKPTAAPAGGPLPLDEFMHNMQDPLGYAIYSNQQRIKKQRRENIPMHGLGGGGFRDGLPTQSPERAAYLAGIEKTAPRLGGQQSKVAGQESIQRAVGTTSMLQKDLQLCKLIGKTPSSA